MLVLTRKTQQQIQIGDNIKITVLRVKGRSVRIGIEAPTDVKVLRGELPHNSVKGSTKSVAPTAPSTTTRRTMPAGYQGQTDMRDEHSSASMGQPLAAALLRRRTPSASAAPATGYPDCSGTALLRGLLNSR